MKTCPHCGKELPGEMQFCPYCMQKLIAEQAVGGTPPPRRRSVWLWIIGGVVALTLLWVLLVWGLGRLSDRQPPTSEPLGDSADLFVDGDGLPNVPMGGTTDKAASTTTTPVTGTTAGEGASPSAEDDVDGTTTATTADKGGSTTTAASSGGALSKDTSSAATTTASSGGALSKDTSSAATTAAPCANGHNWEEITQTVQHDEVGHYEKVVTGYNTVTIYKCAVCYDSFNSLDRYYTHFDEHLAASDALVAILRDRYTTSQEQQPIYDNQWVVDEEAYTETRVIGHKCRVCGKTK